LQPRDFLIPERGVVEIKPPPGLLSFEGIPVNEGTPPPQADWPKILLDFRRLFQEAETGVQLRSNILDFHTLRNDPGYIPEDTHQALRDLVWRLRQANVREPMPESVILSSIRPTYWQVSHALKQYIPRIEWRE